MKLDSHHEHKHYTLAKQQDTLDGTLETALKYVIGLALTTKFRHG